MWLSDSKSIMSYHKIIHRMEVKEANHTSILNPKTTPKYFHRYKHDTNMTLHTRFTHNYTNKSYVRYRIYIWAYGIKTTSSYYILSRLMITSPGFIKLLSLLKLANSDLQQHVLLTFSILSKNCAKRSSLTKEVALT